MDLDEQIALELHVIHVLQKCKNDLKPRDPLSCIDHERSSSRI